MNTNDTKFLRAVHSRNLFQIELIDRPSDNPLLREQFIAFIINDPKVIGGVKFAISPVNVMYRYTIGSPTPLYKLIAVHFNVQVTAVDDHLKTFLHKIRKGSKVVFIVTINQSDEKINKLGLENHLLTGRIGSETYLINSWVGKPEQRSPVQYPRTLIQASMPIGGQDLAPVVIQGFSNEDFSNYNNN